VCVHSGAIVLGNEINPSTKATQKNRLRLVASCWPESSAVRIHPSDVDANTPHLNDMQAAGERGENANATAGNTDLVREVRLARLAAHGENMPTAEVTKCTPSTALAERLHQVGFDDSAVTGLGKGLGNISFLQKKIVFVPGAGLHKLCSLGRQNSS